MSADNGTARIRSKSQDSRAKLDRRDFLGTTVGAFTLGFFLPGFERPAAGAPRSVSTQVNAWISIGSDESIKITVGCAELGQGSLSGLPQIVAEELMVDFSRVIAVQAGASQSYVTGGSSSIRSHYLPLRQAGAAAREMLVAAAITKSGGVRSDWNAAHGVVTHAKTKVSITYGQLAPIAAKLPVPPITSAWPPLTPDSQFKVIGRAVPRLDLPSKVDGSAIYGLDVRLPGMVYAVIKHCPWFGGTLAGTPPIPEGATAVVPTKVIPSTARGAEAAGNVNAVAVVASNTWDAWQAANSLSVNWNIPTSTAAIDSGAFFTQAQQLMSSSKSYIAESAGNIGAGLSGVAKLVDATYSLPYVAHACLEVLNCTVNLTSKSCEVWAPTQAAGFVAATVQGLTGLAASQITVHTTLLGGGLGRKFEQDFISQAVQVAQAIKMPVKLMWPREEDFSHDQYRPMALIHVRAGLDASKNVTGWSYRNVSPSILSQRGWPLSSTGDSQATEGATSLPYNFGSRLVDYVIHPAGVPVGFWRSVGNSLNAFAVESMIDELALAANMDPYLFRRKLLAASPRHLAVLDAAANLAFWRTAPPSGHARGIALVASFDSVVAEVVEISRSGNGMNIHHVACAVDCGRPINPNSIEAQMQGGIVHGINAALWGQVTFKNGSANVRNFRQNRMLRMGEMPQIDVVIMPPNPSVPVGGIGEPGVPPIAPALANAYAKLTGNRVRTLPFFPGSTMGGL